MSEVAVFGVLVLESNWITQICIADVQSQRRSAGKPRKSLVPKKRGYEEMELQLS